MKAASGRFKLPENALLCTLLVSLLLTNGAAPIAAPNPDAATTSIENRTTTAIRLAAQSRDHNSHPLPLVGSWNTGVQRGIVGFDADFQLQRITRGDYLLPWFALSRPDELFVRYAFEDAFAKAAVLRLPVSFISTQWDVLVAEELRDRKAGITAAAVRGRYSSSKTQPLSPFSPVNIWYEAGMRWGQHAVLQRLQTIYPDPPRILFISNNEQPRMSWRDIRRSPELLQLVGDNPSDEAIRRAVGDAWIVRYQALQRGFRDALTAPGWKANSIFVGYDAFATAAVGRWHDWIAYSLLVPERLEPWPLAWEGVSPSYYVPDWSPASDFQVMSPQIEAMNWLPFLREALQLNPQLWFELSVWDGQQQTARTDKAAVYRKLGQQYDPERYAGYLQFGMWLLRPRVVREFRDHLATRKQFVEYFDSVTASVARVHEQPVLKRFWQSARLLPNTDLSHPYTTALPDQLAQAQRWYLLDADQNPPRPWALDTTLPVYSLALESGAAPQREWLIYAFTPLHQKLNAAVTIPGGPRIHVAAARSGCFTLVREGRATATTLTCGQS